MRELPWPALLIHNEEPILRKLRFGHDGYAQVADALQRNSRGVAGDSEISDEVSDGGDTGDFKGMLIGLANADREESDEVDDEGESDALLLLSENIVFRVARRVPKSGAIWIFVALLFSQRDIHQEWWGKINIFLG